MTAKRNRTIVAHHIGDSDEWKLVPAEYKRQWMDATPNAFAYRCLPLVVANQAGWVIQCPVDFSVKWTGKALDFAFSSQDARFKNQISSHFGSGIITFSIPYLFRTPANIGLLARGMPNEAKLNCVPLEGFVETDWSVSTFTMNWRILQPHVQVNFRKGDPICFLQPHSMALIESLDAVIRPLHVNKKLSKAHGLWAASRAAFNANPNRGRDWQKHYFKGQDVQGKAARTHRTKVKVAPFSRELGDEKPVQDSSGQ